MQRAEEPTVEAADGAPGHASRSPVSVAILAAVACIPIVVAAGFLTDRGPDAGVAATAPADISVLALRGALDASPQGRPIGPLRAGY